MTGKSMKSMLNRADRTQTARGSAVTPLGYFGGWIRSACLRDSIVSKQQHAKRLELLNHSRQRAVSNSLYRRNT
jgi:hypothetical protein